MRDLHPDFAELIQTDDITPVKLVELDMLPDPQYLWDGIGDLQYNGKTFRGVGALGDMEPVKETKDIKASKVKLTLNTVDHVEDFSDLREISYQKRGATVHYGLLSQTENSLIAVDQNAFIGRMDDLKVKTRNNRSSIELSLVNEMDILKQSWGRFQTDSDHQIDYPGDTSRRFVAAIQDLTIRI